MNQTYDLESYKNDNLTENDNFLKQSDSNRSMSRIQMVNESRNSSFSSTHSFRSNTKRCNSHHSRSRTNLANLIHNITLNDRNVTWSIVSEEEHKENLRILSAVMRDKNTSKPNNYLKEHDYNNIDMLVLLNSSMNQINDQDTHNMWVKQVRFYVRMSQVGLRNAVSLENPKSSNKNLIQRQLNRLFEIW